MGLDDGEIDGETFDEIEINGKINGEVDGEIARVRNEPTCSLAALKVRALTLDPAKPSPNPNPCPRPNQGALRCLLDMRDAAYAYVRHDDRK
eukprot:scaffold86931_cov85-Phaeocystis_antarctica.AAC.1